MAQAFPDIAEPPADSEAPLDALAACNQRLLRHCAALRRLALYVGECGFDPQARAATDGLLHFFDRVLPLHHAHQQAGLYPVLIESMAGSDAVCLRELTDAAIQQQREVRQLWLRLRPALGELTNGRATQLPVHEIDTLVAMCQRAVERDAGELLPMAARLLSDGDLQQIGAGMRQRQMRAVRTTRIA